MNLNKNNTSQALQNFNLIKIRLRPKYQNKKIKEKKDHLIFLSLKKE
jgi:hypothetical protein